MLYPQSTNILSLLIEGEYNMANKYTAEQKEQMIELRKLGLTFNAIAKQLGINNSTTIINVCIEAGLPKTNQYPEIKESYSTGQRFNNFVLLEKAPNKITKTGRVAKVWECKCDCGKIFTITTKQIHRGQKSCGCLSLGGLFTRGETRDVIGQHKYGHYTFKAKDRGLSWDLSKECFMELLFANCHYCKSPPSTLVKLNSHETMVNGVDRVNSDLGYSQENCVACCKFCNRAKSDATLQEFLEWIDKLKNNQ